MKGIRIGISLGDLGGEGATAALEASVQQFSRAEAAGFKTAWVPNIFSFDAMTLLALAGSRTRSIELGTAVVPTFSRHPFYMAQQALSTAAATGGRFVLGLGPSHKVVIENMLGLSFDKVAQHVEEYVRVVKALVETGKVAFQGQCYRVNAALQIASARPFPVLIGGLGPRMRKIAATLADGTITWMAGRRTIGETLAPQMHAAARAAGRKDSPRIVCGLPVVVTSDAAGAREAASKSFAIYGQLPSYRAMLDLEGAKGPGDVAVAGDAREVERQIEALAAAGVTDLNAALFPYGPDAKASFERTYEVLAELARQ
ncbi:MAG TPA: TIGR03564 family F420-dependent LLM class oxidoreductase [Myxococcota bacterium]|nr:TIGR03564 family F420-dependent LLM class oxidoreductase [Myxococcota bacterium]